MFISLGQLHWCFLSYHWGVVFPLCKGSCLKNEKVMEDHDELIQPKSATPSHHQWQHNRRKAFSILTLSQERSTLLELFISSNARSLTRQCVEGSFFKGLVPFRKCPVPPSAGICCHLQGLSKTTNSSTKTQALVQSTCPRPQYYSPFDTVLLFIIN